MRQTTRRDVQSSGRRAHSAPKFLQAGPPIVTRKVSMKAINRTTAALAALLVTAGGASASAAAVADSAKTVVTFAYSANYYFFPAPQTTTYLKGIEQQFDSEYPNATLKPEPIQGAYNDIIEKLSLMYHSPSTAPDVAMIPTGEIGLWASTGYLRPLNQYLSKAGWWSKFPTNIQQEGELDGSIDAVNDGENTSLL